LGFLAWAASGKDPGFSGHIGAGRPFGALFRRRNCRIGVRGCSTRCR
jgi:hypothetical protein